MDLLKGREWRLGIRKFPLDTGNFIDNVLRVFECTTWWCIALFSVVYGKNLVLGGSGGLSK